MSQRRGSDPQQQFKGCDGPQLDRLHQRDVDAPDPGCRLCLPVPAGGSRRELPQRTGRKKMRRAEDPDFVKQLGSGVLEDSLWRTGWMVLFFTFYPSAHATCKHASHTRPGTERPWGAQQLSAIGPPPHLKINNHAMRWNCNCSGCSDRTGTKGWEGGVRAWPPGASCSYGAKQNAKIVL